MSIGMKVRIKEKYNGYELFLVAFCIISVVLTIYRCFFGIGNTDEPFYVSSAIGMLKGNIPYAYNNFYQGTGGVFLLIPQLAVFQLFSPNFEGVFLFQRISFVLFRIIILAIVYKIFRKEMRREYALLIVAILIPYSGSIVGNCYSYNSSASWLMLLVGALLFNVLEKYSKYPKVELFAAGFITGVGVFSHPLYACACILFLILIYVYSSKSAKMSNLLLYCAGGILQILSVFVPISIMVGGSKLIEGMSLYLHNPYQTTSPSGVEPMSIQAVVDIVLSQKKYYVLCVIVITVVYLVAKKYKSHSIFVELEEKDYRLLAICCAFCALLVVRFLLFESREIYEKLGYTAFICAICCIIGGLAKKNKLLMIYGIYPTLFSFLILYIVNEGGLGRFNHAYPTAIAIFVLFFKSKSKYVRTITSVLAIFICILLNYANFDYVYQDNSIGELNFQVDRGVYKGLYTTQPRNTDLVELENYLNENISSEERYCFRDNVPFAYLMIHDGIMCEVDTWDVMYWCYGRNNPGRLYDYYERVDMIPDKIIYVDYGQEEGLSIDSGDFKYNDFVHTYYQEISNTKLNDTFKRIVIYEYKGGFDGDYQCWIKPCIINE